MEKVIALTLLVSLLPTAQRNSNPRDLRISVSVVEGEHSRDSNSSATTITIKDNDMVYDRSYAGYGARKRKAAHQEIKLTGQELDQLRQLISKESLLVSRSTQLPTHSAGRYVIVIMNLKVGKRKSAIKVSGMTNRIENETLYKRAKALIDEIDRIRVGHGASILSTDLPQLHDG